MTSETPATLAVERLTKTFRTGAGPVKALDSVSFEMGGDVSVSCLVGPSGSGKSTILNIIAGLDEPDEGRVLVDGAPVAEPGRDRMMMFQDSSLFPWLNVFDNVLFGLKLKPGLTRAERRDVAQFHLELVGMAKFQRAFVHELSGGMRQRAALARALAPNPRILLMDEPFASLDAMTRENLYTDLQEIWRKRRKTIVFVTHNVREAVCLGDRVLLLSASPGKILATFPIPLPRPRDINSVDVARYASELTAALRRRCQNEETLP